MLDRMNVVNDTKYDLAPRSHTVSMVFRALIDTLYHFRHALAGVGALVIMVLWFVVLARAVTHCSTCWAGSFIFRLVCSRACL